MDGLEVRTQAAMTTEVIVTERTHQGLLSCVKREVRGLWFAEYESESGNHIANWVLSTCSNLNLWKMKDGICQRNIIFLKNSQ